MMYQLFKHQFSVIGMHNGKTYVVFDGPYDRYGYLLNNGNEKGVYLIRGCGKVKPF